MTMIKGKPQDQSSAGDSNAPQFRENPDINAKIDNFIKANPKRWEYIQAMSPERMARTIVLQDVQKQERTERIRSGVLKKLEDNPEAQKGVSDAREEPAGGPAGEDDGEPRDAYAADGHQGRKPDGDAVRGAGLILFVAPTPRSAVDRG